MSAPVPVGTPKARRNENVDVGMGVFMIVGITALIYGIRYVLYKVFYAGADAIENAYKQKKNKGKAETSENLADRYNKK